MNTIAWMLGALASLWMSVFALTNLEETELAFALLGLTFLCLVFVVWGAIADVQAWTGRGHDRED